MRLLKMAKILIAAAAAVFALSVNSYAETAGQSTVSDKRYKAVEGNYYYEYTYTVDRNHIVEPWYVGQKAWVRVPNEYRIEVIFDGSVLPFTISTMVDEIVYYSNDMSESGWQIAGFRNNRLELLGGDAMFVFHLQE